MASIGIALMLFLLYQHYHASSLAVCNITDKISCDLVNKSEYSTLLGIPVALLGALFFLVLLLSIPRLENKVVLRWVARVSTLALAFGLYLSFIEAFVLHEWCIFCELSKVVLLVIVILLWKKNKNHKL
jgi:uncharacterized membrane protein